MADLDDKLEQLMATLRQERDELRLQAHLAKAEVRDELAALEDRYNDLEGRVGAARKEAAAAGEDIGAAASQLGQELLKGFRRVAKRLAD